MTENRTRGAVIGVTDEGYPIVTEDYGCARWAGSGRGLSVVRECWYCKYADFRKRTDVTFAQSVCRCPENRRTIYPGSENECQKGQGGKHHD